MTNNTAREGHDGLNGKVDTERVERGSRSCSGGVKEARQVGPVLSVQGSVGKG